MVKRRGFGKVRKLPSKRYQASYVGPGSTGVRYTAPRTFDTAEAAGAWLRKVQSAIADGTWTPAVGQGGQMASAGRTLGDYAAGWLAARTVKPRTREHYQRLLDRLILPSFDRLPVKTITPDLIRDWHTRMGASTPTLRAHAYSLLRSILGDAVHDGLIGSNPAHIRGAGNSKRVHKIKPATLEELSVLVDAMPERYRVMTLIAAWCGLRFGELTELRRGDIDVRNGLIRIRRGVVRTDAGYVVGTPKSNAGIRDVKIPPHLMPAIKDHLAGHVNGRNGLLFPAADGASHLAPSTLYKVYYPAREKAGRPDLRWHDLRHTGAVLAASTGATLAALMARLGHSTAGAALRYQHAAAEDDARIAERLSALAGGAR